MEITVKNLKIANFASEETLCFEATVYVDGVRAFTATNDGHGGSNMYHTLSPKFDRTLLDKAEAWVKEQPDVTCESFGENRAFTYKPCLDHFVDEAVTAIRIEKDFKKVLKRASFVADGKILQFNCKPDAKGWREQALKKYPKAIILNDIPEDEAFALYKKEGTA